MLQALPAFCHAAEIKDILKENTMLLLISIQMEGQTITRHTRVQLSLVALFRSLNLDMLIARRTVPAHSWANLVGPINLVYQIQ